MKECKGVLKTMARVNINEDTRSLDDLIVSYYQNKSELDGYKKICDAENSSIKSKMLELKEDSHTSDGITAKIVIQKKESFNEAKLLAVAKQFNLDVIKTKEYVDMDALESLMFSNNVPTDAMVKLSDCKEVTEVTTLRISRAKEK